MVVLLGFGSNTKFENRAIFTLVSLSYGMGKTIRGTVLLLNFKTKSQISLQGKPSAQ